jgi:XTP/dITP diphosphohydrolase
MNMQLLIATRNVGKVKELEKLLADLPVTVRSLNDFPNVPEAPEETGATFADNAQIKAKFYAERAGILALADDSGLTVDALGGAPGVLSARYAGIDATDADRIAKLLKELNQTGDEKRRASFVCAIAVADARGEIKHLAEAACAGRIADSAKGANGFGYDPVFIPDGFELTFGELSARVKERISHRARAIKKIIRYLRLIYGASA